MNIVNTLDPTEIPMTRACAALAVSRATFYRGQKSKPTARAECTRRKNPRRLSDSERAAVLDMLHSDEFADQPPAEVFAALLSRGEYVASIRTMYRVLAERGEVRERRRQRHAQKHPVPMLSATLPNQVWTWDITKLRGPEAGVFFALYVIIDLFSRMVVGWLLAEKETTQLAQQLFAEACARHHVEPGTLVVHADRGASMRSEGLAQLLGNLGVDRSFSRPRVSDDNAFSEAQFKTMKYQPDYPERFGSPLHARGWAQEFFGWYNEHHHHSGIALFTPADVFYGRVDDIIATRQRALDEAFAAHPERFPNGPPVARRPPPLVQINPPLPRGEEPAVTADAQQDARMAASAFGAREAEPLGNDQARTQAETIRPQVRAPSDEAEPRGATASQSPSRPGRAELRQPQARRHQPLQPVPS
jgi:putative transposase